MGIVHQCVVSTWNGGIVHYCDVWKMSHCVKYVRIGRCAAQGNIIGGDVVLDFVRNEYFHSVRIVHQLVCA